MDIKLISKTYDVRRIQDIDVLKVFHLCEKNPQYYHYCPPAISIDGIKADMQALPFTCFYKHYSEIPYSGYSNIVLFH